MQRKKKEKFDKKDSSQVRDKMVYAVTFKNALPSCLYKIHISTTKAGLRSVVSKMYPVPSTGLYLASDHLNLTLKLCMREGVFMSVVFVVKSKISKNAQKPS